MVWIVTVTKDYVKTQHFFEMAVDAISYAEQTHLSYIFDGSEIDVSIRLVDAECKDDLTV